MNKFKPRATVAAISLAALSPFALAQTAPATPPVNPGFSDLPEEAIDQKVSAAVKAATAATGLEFTGYLRSGFYGAPTGDAKGGYTLGGDLQKYRLGNEGDNYMDFGLGKVFNVADGVKWGAYYMPKVYNGTSGTSQIYTTLGGFSFAPELTFWAGQRFHRIADIHIVDNWLAEDGDNYGAGVDGIKVGSGVLNLAAYTDGSMDNKNRSSNDAKRFNVQLKDLAVNPGGKLSLTAAGISGKFAQGSDGAAFGLVHQQSNFLTEGLNNTLFLQTSTGHADVRGKFYNLDNNGTAQMGAKQSRITNAIDWQVGPFGGQALVGYQTNKPDVGPKLKDFSLGGRVSYGIAKYTKLLAELGTTERKIDGLDAQRLTKGTLAVAFAPNTKFWTRPEFRVYATRANWNNAAANANKASFGKSDSTSGTAFGVQMEAWW